MEGECFIINLDGMTGVGTTGKTNYELGIFREIVHHFPFTFVAPLGADYD